MNPSAQLGGGTAADTVAVGEAQLGKPFAWGTDGPGTFSCVGSGHLQRPFGEPLARDVSPFFTL